MKVTIYSAPWCAFCKVEKQWLDKLGVKYSEVNIEEDEKAREYLGTLELQGVPVTVIEKSDSKITEVIHGFDRVRLSEALGLDK